MRGWFRRQKASTNDSVEGMETTFHGIIRQVRTEMSDTRRMAVAYCVAFAWRAFNLKFSSAEGFLKLSSAAKADFINCHGENVSRYGRKR
jgi:hypothetical protein